MSRTPFINKEVYAMDAVAAKFKAEMLKHKVEGGGRLRFSAQQQRIGREYAKRRIERGATKASIARELGVSEATIWRWTHSGFLTSDDLKVQGGFKTVRIADEPGLRPTAQALRLVTPEGYRIEGLDLAGAATLLRGLR
jgi:hypothetical protein